MALTNYGEQFAANVLRKFYAKSLTPAITNSDYEGEIKKAGDRVSVLMFLEDIALSDYAVGTDMAVQHPIDTEAQLIVEKKKYYDFDIDAVDKQFTYVEDENSTLIENAEKALEKAVDTYVLENAYWVKAGNFVGVNQLMLGNAGVGGTMASILTSATGGTIRIAVGSFTTVNTHASPDENHNLDGRGISSILYNLGFGNDCIGKAIRLVSLSGACTDWWRITGIVDTLGVTVENWDGSVTVQSTPAVAAGDVLKGLHLRDNKSASGGPRTEAGWGYEIQGAIPTTVTATTIYDAIVDLATILDDNDIPAEDRHITVPAPVSGMLKKASELQPDIAMYYEGVIINGKVGRVGGFDIHLATGSRCSTRAGRSTGAGAGASQVVTASGQGYQVLANHRSFITFAEKYSESRVVDAQAQFAKLYQGLFLYGGVVLPVRRRAGAQLFCTW